MSIKDIIISRNIKKRHRKIQFYNFETAKSVSILYSIDSKDNYNRIKEYIKKLSDKGLKIRSIGFVKDSEEIGRSYFGQKNSNFYSEKHISKFGSIKEVCINDFINAKDDILINLTFSNNFYLEYVFALSKAKFKVSGIIDCRYSDLNINYERNKGPDFFISQVDFYLSTIKKA